MKTEYFSKFNKACVGFTAIALMFIASPSLFAAEDDADVEEVVVTGSRIKRDTINSASVVTTITSEDIEQSQALLTADILRLSTYNTFGSFGPTAGSSAMSNA
ncbi:MAG: TonB-dependent receptor, partial [Pseudomonadota bacterium]|nr:TonB-dependent receptor [Pseudomonadota bacterium]